MKKILMLILLTTFILAGCSNKENKYLDTISFDKLTDLIENKESFVLEIYQDGCSHCTVFTPRFKSVLKEYEVNAKALNMSNLTEEEYNKFVDIFGSLGTPTVVFIEDGIEKTKINRLVGEASKNEIIRKLKQNGYIEK